MVCTVAGESRYSVIWKRRKKLKTLVSRNGGLVSSFEEYLKLPKKIFYQKYNREEFAMISTNVFVNPLKSDEGVYTCIVNYNDTYISDLELDENS